MPCAADEHVVAGTPEQHVVAVAADEDVVAVAAVLGELDRAGSEAGRLDDVVAGETLDLNSRSFAASAPVMFTRAASPSTATPDASRRDERHVVAARAVDDHVVWLRRRRSRRRSRDWCSPR